MHLSKVIIIKRWQTKWVLFLLLVMLWMITYYTDAVVEGKNLLLSEVVSYYEPLEYSKSTLSLAHARVRRSLRHDQELLLNFTAHGRNFNISLKRESLLFSNDLFMGKKIGSFRPSNIYEGVVLNEPISYVHGFIYDELFEGRILYRGDEFVIESAKQYNDLNPEKTHSVIYNVRDIIHHHPYHCGVSRARPDTGFTENTIFRTKVDPFITLDNKIVKFNGEKRKRRAVDSKTKLVCEIKVRADPTYVAYANNNEDRAMYLMSQHIKTVANTFRSTDFDGDGEPEGYTLAIKRIDTIDTSKCRGNTTIGDCKFRGNHIGAAKFLDLVSTEDNSEYCLSYVFTHRNFDDGILGLAFTSSPNAEKRGGICDTYKSVDGIMKTLNTGIISNTVYGKTVPPKITDIVLAHEIAHNFGSEHDAKDDHKCSPGGELGNYLMYSQAQYGTDKNNLILSPCSKASIWKNLIIKANKCFIERGKSICGNRIVEPGEDCDCGYRDEESCHRDQCCQGANQDGYFGCKFSIKARKVPSDKRCSISQGLCCNPNTCQPYLNNTKTCSQTLDECTKPSNCIDSSYKCQKGEIVPERSFCNTRKNICIKGKCLGSLCLLANKIDCQCTGEDNACKLCCQDKHNASSCRVFKWEGHSVSRPIGSPCNQFEGRCNRLSKCQNVNEDGILSRLNKFLFPHSSLINIYDWAKDNWWACVLIGLALILFIIAFVWSCKQFVPSDGKRKRKPARPFLCVNRNPENNERSPSRQSNTSPRNYMRTPSEEPPRYDDSPPGYNTAIRDNLRYPPSYELEIIR